jgi:L-threonate 2-dehydrogenase
MKFVANLLVAIHNVATAEAMMLARSAGLDLAQVVELVAAGAGGSRMFQMRAPMMVADRYEPATMRISTWQKDMDIIGKFAAGLGVPTPLFTATAPIYDEGMRRGLGPLDTAAVFKILSEPSTGKAHQES